jgi:fumarate hydratase subunit alpha/L(+)-tartrate dehydratase alpha subunit
MTEVETRPLTGEALYVTVEEVSAELYKRSLTDLPPDVRQAVSAAFAAEEGRRARMMLRIIQRAVETSDRTDLIVCQDTGIPVFFVGIGTELTVNGARLIESLGRGIELATKRHNLRSSIVHPITRENRQTSTGREIPVTHIEFLDGADYLDLQLLP